MQERTNKKYVDDDMKQIEIPRETHKALKLEAADRDIPMKVLANDILEGWLDSHRPGWREQQEVKSSGGSATGE